MEQETNYARDLVFRHLCIHTGISPKFAKSDWLEILKDNTESSILVAKSKNHALLTVDEIIAAENRIGGLKVSAKKLRLEYWERVKQQINLL